MEKKNQVPKYPLLRFPEFTDEWKEVKLGEICKVSTGEMNTQDKNENGMYPFYVRSSKIERANRYTYDGVAILTPGDGAIGQIFHYSEGKIAVHQRVYMLTEMQCIPKYLFHCFSSRFFERVSRMSAKNTVDSVRMNMITNMPIALPSLPEQRKIAALLGLIDERIEVQNAIIKEQEVAKTLLSKELLTPEDDWTEYAVQDCLTYEQPAKYIVKHTDYSSDSTLTPVLTANKGFILGYTSEQGIYQKGACIIFDDFTLDCKYVPFAFKVKSSAIKILQARKGFDIRFMFEVIKSLSLSPFAHKRHYISEVEPIKVLVPSLAKQERVSRLFAALDERLDVERAYTEQLKLQKAYLLRQMFI